MSILLGEVQIGYPVPYEAIKAALLERLEIGFEEILYWLQIYTGLESVRWKEYSRAMTRLSELCSEALPEGPIVIDEHDLRLEIGEVDLLSTDIVTIQRDDELIAAFYRTSDGAIRFSGYEPLDARALTLVTHIVRSEGSAGLVSKNSWERAQYYMNKAGNFYAGESGRSYISRWEFGLGVSADGTQVDVWYQKREKVAQNPRAVAAQLEVYQHFQSLMPGKFSA